MTERPQSERQRKLETIIFGTTTPAGRNFDVLLLLMIVASVAIVMLDSMASLHQSYGPLFWRIEFGFTLLFTIEYLSRLWCVGNRRAYATSFWGFVDLLSILPTYVALVIPEAAPLLIIRLLRVMRVFRVLRLLELFAELREILMVLRNTARTIFVFFALVMVVVVIFACLLYVIEGPRNGFTSIPMSIYWAIVTITTVGYGDVTPQTDLGRALAAMGMLIGYSILAVPTAIITRETVGPAQQPQSQININWNCPRVHGGWPRIRCQNSASTAAPSSTSPRKSVLKRTIADRGRREQHRRHPSLATVSTGPSVSAPPLSCPPRERRWINWAWDSCDVILVTGDAYVDHPSFGMAVIGRTLEGQGFSCGHHRPARLA